MPDGAEERDARAGQPLDDRIQPPGSSREGEMNVRSTLVAELLGAGAPDA
jgi:hypothetical protein